MMVWIALLGGMAYLGIQAIKLCLAYGYIRSHTQGDSGVPSALAVDRTLNFSRFTVAQPILSGDPLLVETLRHNVQSLGDRVEFLWLIDESDSTAIEIAKELACEVSEAKRNSAEGSFGKGLEGEAHARVRVLLCPECPENINPKSFKLQIALNSLSTEYLVVLDDDTTIESDSLSAALAVLVDSDLYTGLPSYRRGANLWSDLVAHFVNNNAVLTYLPPLQLFDPISLNGMFYVTRACTLRELGGFAAIERELCDDYALHRLFLNGQKKVHQGISRQEIATSVADRGRYLQLMHRWNLFALLLTRAQPFSTQVYLALFLGLPSILLLGILICGLSSLEAAGVATVVLVLRHITILLSQRFAFRQTLNMNPVFSVLAEVMQPLFLLTAVCYPYINWRGTRLRVNRDHTFQKVKAD